MSGKPFSAHEYFVADELWDTVGWIVEYALRQLYLLGDPLSMWGQISCSFDPPLSKDYDVGVKYGFVKS